MSIPGGKVVSLLRAEPSEHCETDREQGEDGTFTTVGCGARGRQLVRIGLGRSGSDLQIVHLGGPGNGPAKSLSLPPDSQLDIDRIEGEPSVPPCDGSAPPNDIDVMFYTTKAKASDAGLPATRTLHVRIEKIDVDAPIEDLAPSSHCRNTVLARRKVALVCSRPDGNSQLSVQIRGAALFLSTGSSSIATGGGGLPWGGVDVGCGSRLRTKAFTLGTRQPGLGDACSARCSRARDECSERCSLRDSDDDGALTEKGRACAAVCQKRQETCTESCLTRGK